MQTVKSVSTYVTALMGAITLIGYQNCSGTPAASGSSSILSSASTLSVGCYYDGSTLVPSGTVESNAYTVSSVAAGSACPAAAALTCTNGVWTGGESAFSTCSVESNAAAVGSCSFDGSTIATGATVTAYPAATDATCSASEQVTCTNGVLSTADGTSYTLYPSLTCTVSATAGSYSSSGFSATPAYSDPNATSGIPYCGTESPTSCSSVGSVCFIYSGWWWNDDAGQNEYNIFTCSSGTSSSVLGDFKSVRFSH